MPVDPLLFVGQAPDGDLFAVLTQPWEQFIRWNHETDARLSYVLSMEKYLKRRSASLRRRRVRRG